MNHVIQRHPLRALSAALLLVGLQACSPLAPPPEALQGQVEVRRVNVSAKLPGRLENVLVSEGEKVEVGQVIAVLSSPELEAKMAQVDATIDAAQAQESKANTGARDEEIRAARANWERAEAGARLAKTTYDRVNQLYSDGVVPAQKRDEAQAQFRASRMLADAARAQYDMARSGARSEDRDAAAALVRQAQGGRQELEAYLAETQVKSPIAGEVSSRIVEEGELVSPGLPIVIVADLDDAWVTFNVREDKLPGLTMGAKFTGNIPAMNGKDVELEISYLAPVGDFATWRSTRASGGYDLKTFEVRARPVQPVPGLRPGMSVVVPVSALPKAGE